MLKVCLFEEQISLKHYISPEHYDRTLRFHQLLLVCLLGYVAYFIAACVLDFQRAIALVVLTSLAVAAQSYELLKKYKGDSISQCFRPAVQCFRSNLKWMKW